MGSSRAQITLTGLHWRVRILPLIFPKAFTFFSKGALSQLSPTEAGAHLCVKVKWAEPDAWLQPLPLACTLMWPRAGFLSLWLSFLFVG